MERVVTAVDLRTPEEIKLIKEVSKFKGLKMSQFLKMSGLDKARQIYRDEIQPHRPKEQE